eukprot:g5029.t1
MFVVGNDPIPSPALDLRGSPKSSMSAGPQQRLSLVGSKCRRVAADVVNLNIGACGVTLVFAGALGMGGFGPYMSFFGDRGLVQSTMVGLMLTASAALGMFVGRRPAAQGCAICYGVLLFAQVVTMTYITQDYFASAEGFRQVPPLVLMLVLLLLRATRKGGCDSKPR